ncbi:hypothetical protein M9H77_23964 [Catharanthus roseus]|uniref:Uncharacterized protein n=1 Tax=Catharanthus roseus TaxID=4058 RepID=A0ACC0AVU4_CATRO|nr:hypothetical protein M9H77_23964 [Catharanthus roseus]
MNVDIDRVYNKIFPLIHHYILSPNHSYLVKGQTPSSVLFFIFSPTLYLVRTSLLSIRWKLLWTQVPTIRFNAWGKDEISNITPNNMGKRIERIVIGIFIHHNAPSLDILYLHMEGKISKLYSWISVAMPENLFICVSLECLKLCDLQVMIRGEVYLSRLHTLVLSYVTFGDEESFHKIVDGCPILESLCFIKIFDEWDYITTILVSSRALKRFDMTFSSDYK